METKTFCKRGVPILMRGLAAHFCVTFASEFTRLADRYLFLLKENHLCKFIQCNFRKNQVWWRLHMFRVYIGTYTTIPQTTNVSPHAFGDCHIYMGISIWSPYAYRDSPVTNCLHMVVVCIWGFGHQIPICKKMHMGTSFDPRLNMEIYH